MLIVVNKDQVAGFNGVVWGAIPLSYWLTGEPNSMYFVIFIVNCVFLALFPPNSVPVQVKYIWFVVCVFLFLSVMNEFGGAMQLSSYFSLLLFCINITFIFLNVSVNSTKFFLRNFFCTTSFFASLHVVLVMLGGVENHFGRFFFFGNSHPNLGGEIYAVAALAGALSMRRRHVVLIAVPLVLSCFLLQSRTGLAVVLGSVVIRYFVSDSYNISKKSFFGTSCVLVFLGSMLAAFSSVQDFVLSFVVLADDANRGLSSGFVTGRDVRWVQAWQDFADAPFFGNGLSWYALNGGFGAHNPVLYSLVYFGVFAFLFWFIISWGLLKLLFVEAAVFSIFIPSLLMIALNDRFLSSNAFPLIFYFCVLRMFEVKMR